MPFPPRNAMARLAAALQEPDAPDYRGLLLPLERKSGEVGWAVPRAVEELPAAIVDLLMARPFGRSMNRLAAAQETGTPYAEALDYGDVLGMTAMPAAVGAGAMAAGAVPEASAGVFAGKLAKTANHWKRRTAEGMDASGAFTPDEIFKETGWFKGADGQWRFEISDKAMQIKSGEKPGWFRRGAPAERLEAGKSVRGTMGGIVDHPELYAAYPDMKNMGLKLSGKDGYAGAYSPLSDKISVRGYHKDIRGGLAHELQHAIQKREGFASGSSPDREWRPWHDRDPLLPGWEAHRAYERTMGEVEARNATRRLEDEFLDFANRSGRQFDKDLSDAYPNFPRHERERLAQEDKQLFADVQKKSKRHLGEVFRAEALDAPEARHARDRLRKVEALIARGATEGEREAARAARNRMAAGARSIDESAEENLYDAFTRADAARTDFVRENMFPSRHPPYMTEDTLRSRQTRASPAWKALGLSAATFPYRHPFQTAFHGFNAYQLYKLLSGEDEPTRGPNRGLYQK